MIIHSNLSEMKSKNSSNLFAGKLKTGDGEIFRNSSEGILRVLSSFHFIHLAYLSIV